MSTYSTTLRLELIGAGEQDGTWGDTTNNNLGDLIEAAITNVVNITFSDANYTLTAFNGLPDESRNAVLNLIGTNTAQRNLIAPAVEKTYIIKNSTGANVAITTGGANVVISNGSTQYVWCDGTNFYVGVNFVENATNAVNAVNAANATNATNAVNATNAANATNATNSVNATRITNAGGWNITPSGTKLFFNYNGANVASIDSSGNLIMLANVTAYGTP
jgi:hypothetical protein